MILPYLCVIVSIFLLGIYYLLRPEKFHTDYPDDTRNNWFPWDEE